MRDPRIILVGEQLKYRSFRGANKALPVLASCLSGAGFQNVLQLDLEGSHTRSDLIREAASADLIAFCGALSTQWPEIDETIKVVHHSGIKGAARPAIFVGGYAAKGAEDILRASPLITGLFDGEGEIGIVQLAGALAAEAPLAMIRNIKGVCFIDDGGAFQRSTSNRVVNFDAVDQGYEFVHVPTKHNMEIFQVGRRQLKTAQLFTQRGCPWVCGYCNKSMESNSVVRLSEDSLRNQLRKLRREGYEAVYLDVDTFTVNESACRREADILFEEGFFWGSNTRVDQISEGLMSYLYARGCRYMFCGVEHTKPEVILAAQKFNGTFEAQMLRAIQYSGQVRSVYNFMRMAGLPSSYFVILGMPKAVLNVARTSIVGFEKTSFEDDMEAIRFGIFDCDADYLNMNVLRFMPGSRAADVPDDPIYSCVRPSKGRPITAGYFLPRVAEFYGYERQSNHGIFRVFEAIGPNQPTTTAVDPERCYRTISMSFTMINSKINSGRKRTRLFFDEEISLRGLISMDNDGRYSVAPLKEFEGL